MATVLEIENLTKKYTDDKVAIQNVNLTVEEGEICGFIGHNGAGKSTTLKSIVGILSVRHGDIKVMGHSILKEPKVCQQMMAYIPDNPDLYEFMTGIDYVNFIADMFEVPKAEREERINYFAEAFEMTNDLGDLISSYSHGMKQKIALIGAFVHKPKLLVLDEPFLGLDPKATAVLKQTMHDLCAEGGAILFSTHVLDVAEKLCDRVAMIDHGKIVITGITSELTKDCSLEDVFLKELKKQEAENA